MASRSAPGQRDAQDQRTRMELMSALNIYSDPDTIRKSGIICTIGPVSRKVDTLLSLMKAGMCVVRLNFSHGTHDYHEGTIANARAAAKQFGSPIAIALDTKGPEIRTGLLQGFNENPGTEIHLVKDAKIILTSDEAFKEAGTKDKLYVDYKNLSKVMKAGGLIYIDDGLISLKADKCGDGEVHCTVVNSGSLGSRKGCNLPLINVDLPAVSEKDLGDLTFGVEQGVDMVFASFIRKRADVQEVRKVLGEKGKKILIVSKIENHEGMQNFDEILDESDGIMVARGDLGIEIPAEKVFLAQKMMIAKCNMAGKPVICATQMLESMVKNPRPTRAEGSDVANAILDGADCVMLSGETAKGSFPVEAVTIMARICNEAESAIFYNQLRSELSATTTLPTSTTETCSLAAVDASVKQGARSIILMTTTGRTARLIAKWRPLCPILAVTRFEPVARQLHLHRGVHPMYYPIPKPSEEEPWSKDVDDRFLWAMEQGKRLGVITTGDTVVGVHGWQRGSGHTNTVRILVVP